MRRLDRATGSTLHGSFSIHSMGQLDGGKFLRNFDVFWFLHFNPDAGSFHIPFGFVDDFNDALRKTALPRCLHRLVAKSEGHEKASLVWSEVQNIPVLELQPQ